MIYRASSLKVLMFLRWVDFQPFLLKQWRQRQIFTETSLASSLDLRKLPTSGGCEPSIWDELNLMQKGLSKTWSVGLCFFIHFLANIRWRYFSLNLWAVLDLNFRGYFLFLPNVERVVGWLGREWIIVGWRSPQNYSLGNQYNVDPHIMSILLLFNIYQVTSG